MIFNYHTSIQGRAKTAKCKLVQVMVSGYRMPTTVNTKPYDNWEFDQGIIIHQDYYRTPTRYGFMSPTRKKQCVEELSAFMTSPKVKGIVVHTDTAVSKTALSHLRALTTLTPAFTEEQINLLLNKVVKAFKSPMFDPQSVRNLVYNSVVDLLVHQKQFTVHEFVRRIEFRSSLELLKDLNSSLKDVDLGSISPLLFENTCKCMRGESLFGTPERYFNFIKEARKLGFPWISGCFDMEHAFATAWNVGFTSDYSVSLTGDFTECVKLVHLNTIPYQINFGNYLDRHFQTTVFEGKVKYQTYLELVDLFNKIGIDHIREVDSTTRERELCQLEQL